MWYNSAHRAKLVVTSAMEEVRTALTGDIQIQYNLVISHRGEYNDFVFSPRGEYNDFELSL